MIKYLCYVDIECGLFIIVVVISRQLGDKAWRINCGKVIFLTAVGTLVDIFVIKPYNDGHYEDEVVWLLYVSVVLALIYIVHQYWTLNAKQEAKIANKRAEAEKSLRAARDGHCESSPRL
jgi:phosphotransferase system  glucose/maltose/N-acetylglucosamine-specific IIC component